MIIRLWALILVGLLHTVPAWSAVQRFAVLVGNDQGGRGDTELRYAESDARKVAKVLREVGGFEPADITLLTGEDAPTVRRTLISANDRIRAAQSLPDTEALLFVYYSGHADGQALRMGTSRFEFRELAQLVRGSAARFRLLVVDACRSGTLTRVKGGRIVAPFAVADSSLAGEGVAFLTATSSNEDAQESDEIRGSFFTHALVSGLLGAADRDHDGTVVLDEAYQYASDATLRATSRTYGGVQHPTFQFDMKGQGALALTWPTRRQAKRSQLRFPGGLSYLVMADSAQGAVIGEVGVRDTSRVLSVSPGRYFIRGRGEDHLLEGSVVVTAGETHAIEPAKLDRVEYARLVRKGLGHADMAHALLFGPTARSALPNSSRPCWGASLGYRLDLRTVGLLARLGYCVGGFENTVLSAQSHELEFTVGVDHAWDLAGVALNVGGGFGARVTRQSFDSEGVAPPRSSPGGLGFASLGIVLPVWGALFVGADGRLEGHLFRFQERTAQPETLRADAAFRATAFAGLHF